MPSARGACWCSTRTSSRWPESTATELPAIEQRERGELERRAQRFRGDRPRVPLRGRTALVVDDGIATGATARAACRVARAQGASRVVLAVPACSPRTAAVAAAGGGRAGRPGDPGELRRGRAGVRRLPAHEGRRGRGAAPTVGAGAAGAGGPPRAAAPEAPVRDEEVEVVAGPVRLAGHLTVPEHPLGLVVFVHGSGSSRHSPRNRYVAEVLQAGRPRDPAVRSAHAGRGGRPRRRLRRRTAGRADWRG